MADKQKVIVVVPPRPPHAGFWCHGRFYPTGKTETEVSVAERAELLADEAKGFLAVVAPPAAPTLDQLYAMVDEAEAKLEEAKAAAAEAEKAKGKK
jgi:hypothetical protein